MSRIKSIIKLTRVEHGVFVGLVPVSTYVLTAKNVNMITVMILYLSSLLAEMYLFTLNDILNLSEDRVNRPYAPLVRGDISIRCALLISIISLLVGTSMVVTAYMFKHLNMLSLIVYVIAIALGTGYNVRLKKICIIGNLATSITTSLSFLYGMYHISPVPLILFVTSLLACIGREVTKTIVDVEGDRLAGIVTIPIKYGIDVSRKVIAISEILASVILLTLPIYLALTYINIVIIYTPLIVGSTVVSILTILDVISVTDYELLRRKLLKYMFVLIITYFITSVLYYLSRI